MKRAHFQLINHTNVDFVGIVDHPCLKEDLKIPKGVIRIRKSKDRQHIDQQKKDKKTIYKTLHRKLKIE